MKNILTEGGIAGHMKHPYEVMQPEELIDFIENLFKGDIVATEKVDGVNIFFGLDDKGRLSFARSKTEAPFHKVSDRFVQSHPAHDVFAAGIAAIRETVINLSSDEFEHFSLILRGQPNNFINAEIIYGEVPNLITYSRTKNFVVLHAFRGRPDTKYAEPQFASDEIDQNKLLKKFANRLGHITVTSDVVRFFGKPRSVTREVTQEQSKWEFKGPIDVDISDASEQLDKLLQQLRNNRAFIKLNNHIKSKEKLKPDDIEVLAKELRTKAGSKLLTVIRSALADPDIELPTGHPGVEGLVISSAGNRDLEKNLVKITGDFAELNQKAWKFLRDTIPSIKRQFTKSILEEAFGIKRLGQLTDASFRKYVDEGKTKKDIVKEFLLDRSKTFKHDEHRLDSSDIDVYNTVDRYIERALLHLDKVWLDVTSDKMRFEKKIDEIQRAILITAHQFNELHEMISPDRPVVSLFLSVLKALYPVKFVRRQSGLIEAHNIHDYDYSHEPEQRIGVFIGKFDPAHRGHLAIIEEMVDDYNDRILIFVSRSAKRVLSIDDRIEILKIFLKKSLNDKVVLDDKKERNEKALVIIKEMTTGFIPELLNDVLDEPVIETANFTIYAGTDRESDYERQFRHVTPAGDRAWKHDISRTRFTSIERSIENEQTFDDLLSLSAIPVKDMKSTLLRLLVLNGSDDAFRLFINSQPIKDYKFIVNKIWNKLANELGVPQHGRKTKDY